MKDTEAFGAYLKRLRLEKKMTLVELSEKSRTSNSYLSQVETGKRNAPKPDMLKDIAKALASGQEDAQAVYMQMMGKAGYLEVGE